MKSLNILDEDPIHTEKTPEASINGDDEGDLELFISEPSPEPTVFEEIVDEESTFTLTSCQMQLSSAW